MASHTQLYLRRKAGQTSNVIPGVFVEDSTVSTGAGKTAVLFSAVTAYYMRDNATAAVAITMATITTLGTFVSGGWKEEDVTNRPGCYQFHPPDAAFAAGAKAVNILVKGTGIAPVNIMVELVAVDDQDGVRHGLTALPAVASGSAGALPTTGTGANQINVDGAGNASANVVKVAGTTQTARDLGASVLLSAGTGTGQLDFTAGVAKSNCVQVLGGAMPPVTVTGVPKVDVADWMGVAPNALLSGRVESNTQATAATLTFNLTGSVTSVTSAVTLAAKDSSVARTGTAQAGSATTLTLDPGASAVDGFYAGCEVKIDSATAAGQTRVVTGYAGSTKVATVSPAWVTTPDATSVFTVVASCRPKVDGGLQVTAASVQGNVTGSVGAVTAAVTVGTNADKTGYSLSQSFPANFSTLGITAGGHVATVDTVTTLTGHTPQTGDAYAVATDATFGLAKLVRSTTPANTLDVSATGEAGLDFNNIKDATGAHTLTNIRVPNVTLADTLTTYTGNTPQTGDSYARVGATGSGLTTLATQQSVNNLTNLSALANLIGPGTLARPTSGSTAYQFVFAVKDSSGNPVDVTGNTVTLTAANASGTDRGANLSAVTHTGTGEYTFTYTVLSSASDEGLAVTASGVVSGVTRKAYANPSVAPASSLTAIAAIQAQTDRLAFTGANNLLVDLQTIKGQTVTASGGVTFPAGTIGTSTYAGGAVASVTGAVTVGTNTDKTGYALGQSFPANFGALGITAGGHVTTVDTVTNRVIANADQVAGQAVTANAGTNLGNFFDSGGVLSFAALGDVFSAGSVARQFATALELNGTVYRFTTAALANAPGGTTSVDSTGLAAAILNANVDGTARFRDCIAWAAAGAGGAGDVTYADVGGGLWSVTVGPPSPTGTASIRGVVDRSTRARSVIGRTPATPTV